MRTLSFDLLLITLFMISCSTIPDIDRSDIGKQDNLLLNPSFELGMYDRDLMPLGWYTVTDESGTIFWDSSTCRRGDKSLKVSTSKDAVEIISESFPISPKNIYYVNGNVKSLISKHTYLKLAFMAFDKKGRKVNYFYDMFNPDSSWTEIGLQTDFLDEHARFARVIVILPDNAGTDFWIDDVECFIAHKFSK